MLPLSFKTLSMGIFEGSIEIGTFDQRCNRPIVHYLNSLLENQAFLRVILTRSMYLSRTFLTPTRKSRMVPIRPQLVSYLAESNGNG